jgi:hypothetical protein
VRQLEGGGDVQVLLLDPAPDGAGVQERDLRVDRGVQRPVHGNQVVAADKPVQLDVVDVTVLAGPQNGQLMTQDENLDLLGRIGAGA